MAMAITEQEFNIILEECKKLPQPKKYDSQLIVNDYLTNMFNTVLDFQAREKTIGKAINFFETNRRNEIKDFDGL